MGRILIFGMGYTAGFLARRLEARGWDVAGTTRDGRSGSIPFNDRAAVLRALGDATHVLSCVPPDGEGRDAVLALYGEAVALAPARWVGYLSSTGVYGDTGGAWVDESAPIAGRRGARNAADMAWRALRGDVRVFRLPGIYGPGRSAFDRLRAGQGHRVDLSGQLFSRVHVADAVDAVIASFASEATGAFNIADDRPASQNPVMEEAARLLGVEPPPFVPLERLSPPARAFYAENRRVANGRAKRLLGWSPRHADWRAGLRSILEQGG